MGMPEFFFFFPASTNRSSPVRLKIRNGASELADVHPTLGFFSRDAPLGQEVVLVVVLDAAPDAVEEESNGRVQHDVAVEVFMRFVQHAAIVTGVDVVPPAVLGGINVKLGHSHQALLLIVGIALYPTHPVASREAAKPHDTGAQPEVHWTALVGGHHCLLHASIDLGIGGHLRCWLHSLWNLSCKATAGGQNTLAAAALQSTQQTHGVCCTSRL
mmetsp:Transcript_12791/g.13939  ORF Transcript_12791/g.13939 Transcript_12791/m.13939 type:complete len:215 (-) Transcript_12791:52-696(-)